MAGIATIGSAFGLALLKGSDRDITAAMTAGGIGIAKGTYSGIKNLFGAKHSMRKGNQENLEKVTKDEITELKILQQKFENAFNQRNNITDRIERVEEENYAEQKRKLTSIRTNISAEEVNSEKNSDSGLFSKIFGTIFKGIVSLFKKVLGIITGFISTLFGGLYNTIKNIVKSLFIPFFLVFKLITTLARTLFLFIRRIPIVAIGVGLGMLITNLYKAWKGKDKTAAAPLSQAPIDKLSQDERADLDASSSTEFEPNTTTSVGSSETPKTADETIKDIEQRRKQRFNPPKTYSDQSAPKSVPPASSTPAASPSSSQTPTSNTSASSGAPMKDAQSIPAKTDSGKPEKANMSSGGYREVIGYSESGGQYNTTFGHAGNAVVNGKPITQNTINEVVQWQKDNMHKNVHAAGKYGFMDVSYWAKKAGLSGSELFDATNQEKLFDAFRSENQGVLRKLGVDVNETNEFLAHKVGPGGAMALTRAAQNGKGNISAFDALVEQRMIRDTPANRKTNPHLSKSVNEVIAWASKSVGEPVPDVTQKTIIAQAPNLSSTLGFDIPDLGKMLDIQSGDIAESLKEIFLIKETNNVFTGINIF